MSEPLLSMRDVSRSFGATQALDQVSLDVRAGEVLALIGENGAGKSTLMKILSGAILADRGTLTLLGQPFRPRSPQAARAAGVAMIYQELTLAPDLSVEDNVMLGQETTTLGVVRRRSQRARVRAALELLGHPELRLDAPVRSLSVGAQQLVEIARALVSQARLIVFDEPTSSLTLRDVQHLFTVIRRLQAEGLGIVYISHFLEEIRQVCDRYAVLRDGRSVGTGVVATESDERIVSLMVGRDVQDLFPTVPHQPGEPLLEVSHLSGRLLPTDVSFSLRRGEILGLAGLVGAGRTETLRTLFGLEPTRGGEILVAGQRTPATPRGRIRAGLGLLSEDRKGEGLAQTRSLNDNITYSHLAPYSRWGWLNLKQRRAAVDDWMRRLEIKARSAEQPAQSLSGGNQQKVALARVLHQDAAILLLDEPTRGIDVGTKAEIYRLLGQLAADGKAIIFVSGYLPELLAVCDRIGVMSRGRLRELRATKDWTEASIMACAVRGG
ncbi:MAG: sugar ABC transporter ATP-binding protein [Planctomycetota bacterium]